MKTAAFSNADVATAWQKKKKLESEGTGMLLFEKWLYELPELSNMSVSNAFFVFKMKWSKTYSSTECKASLHFVTFLLCLPGRQGME